MIFLLICIFDKNLKQPFLNASPLFKAFLIRKLRSEVFNRDGVFSAGNNMRVTVISEWTGNNSYHLQVRVRLIHCIFDIPVLCKRGEPNDFGSPLCVTSSAARYVSAPPHDHLLCDRGRFSFPFLCGVVCCQRDRVLLYCRLLEQRFDRVPECSRAVPHRPQDCSDDCQHR